MAAESAGEPDLAALYSWIRRHWWLIAGGIALGVAAGVAAFVFLPKAFESTTAVPVSPLSTPGTAGSNPSLNMDTELQLVQSVAAARRFKAVSPVQRAQVQRILAEGHIDPEPIRWVGGYGRMDTASAIDYSAAEADPVEPQALDAVNHLNEDHADALLIMARAFGEYPDATEARCERADRYGLDLELETPQGARATRVTVISGNFRRRGIRWVP